MAVVGVVQGATGRNDEAVDSGVFAFRTVGAALLGTNSSSAVETRPSLGSWSEHAPVAGLELTLDPKFSHVGCSCSLVIRRWLRY